MSGIDNIIQKINEDNQQKIKEVNEQTSISINEIKTLENNKAQVKIDEYEKNVQKLIAEVDRNATSAAQMQNRQELLKARQERLVTAFEQAKEQMAKMDDAKKVSYVKAMVLNCASGVETLVASSNDSIFTDSLLNELNSSLVADGKQGKLTYELVSENVNGIILKNEGMIINLTYDAVVDEIKKEIDTQVAKILFEI